MGTDRTLLIVEDDADTRAVLADFMRRNGYTVAEAEHGCAALEWLLGADVVPCAIVLDLRMPFMSGRELITIVKSYHRLSDIPIVVLSAFEAPCEALRPANRIAYVKKPCDPAAILELVERGASRSSRAWRAAAVRTTT